MYSAKHRRIQKAQHLLLVLERQLLEVLHPAPNLCPSPFDSFLDGINLLIAFVIEEPRDNYVGVFVSIHFAIEEIPFVN